jgi:hypothetical protein
VTRALIVLPYLSIGKHSVTAAMLGWRCGAHMTSGRLA